MCATAKMLKVSELNFPQQGLLMLFLSSLQVGTEKCHWPCKWYTKKVALSPALTIKEVIKRNRPMHLHSASWYQLHRSLKCINIHHTTGPKTFVVLTDANAVEAADRLVGKWNSSGEEYNECYNTFQGRCSMDITYILRKSRGLIQVTLSKNHKAKYGQWGPVLIQPSYGQPALARSLQKLN